MTGKQWPTLYTKTASGKINYWQIWTDGATVHTRWGNVGGEELTDQFEAEGKNIGRSNETSPAEQAILEAESKFKKKKRLKYYDSITKAEGELNLKPMLANKLDENRQAKLRFPVDVQPKLNGYRCMAYRLGDGTIRLMTRGGKDFTLPHIQEDLKGALEPGQHLDGELYCHGMSLQNHRHFIESYSEGSVQIRLVTYDMFWLSSAAVTPWSERWGNLASWFTNYRHSRTQHYVDLIDTRRAQSMEEVDQLHSHWVQQGYEGAMVRLLHGPYRIAARSLHLLKYKKFQDEEFLVIGYDIGKDGVVVFECRQEEGLTFSVRPRGDEQERATLRDRAEALIGQQLTVRFQERTDDNKPFQPVGIGFRPGWDK